MQAQNIGPNQVVSFCFDACQNPLFPITVLSFSDHSHSRLCLKFWTMNSVLGGVYIPRQRPPKITSRDLGNIFEDLPGKRMEHMKHMPCYRFNACL